MIPPPILSSNQALNQTAGTVENPFTQSLQVPQQVQSTPKQRLAQIDSDEGETISVSSPHDEVSVEDLVSQDPFGGDNPDEEDE